MECTTVRWSVIKWKSYRIVNFDFYVSKLTEDFEFWCLKKVWNIFLNKSLSFDTLCICWKYVELSCPFLFFYRESSIWQTNFYFIPNLFELPAKFQLPSIKTVDLYSKRTLHLTGYTSPICETEPVVYLIGMPCMPVFLSLICSIPM